MGNFNVFLALWSCSSKAFRLKIGLGKPLLWGVPQSFLPGDGDEV